MSKTTNTRKNIRYHLNHNEQEDRKGKHDYSSINNNMFIQDFSYVVPYRKDDLKVELKGIPNNQISTICKRFKSRNGYHHQDIVQTFSDFINEAANNVLTFGEAYYEIVYFFEGESNKPSSFSLERIMYDDITVKTKNAIINIPKRVAKEKAIKKRLRYLWIIYLFLNTPRLWGEESS